MFAHLTSLEKLVSYSRVLVDHENVGHADEIDNLITMARMHQISVSVLDSNSASLISNISVFENLWIQSAWMDGCSPIRLRSILSELLGRVNPELGYCQQSLACLLNKRPSELSVDQRCSIVLIRAMLAKPRLVLLKSEWLVSMLVFEQNVALLDSMDIFFPRSTVVAFPSPALMNATYFDKWTRLSSITLGH